MSNSFWSLVNQIKTDIEEKEEIQEEQKQVSSKLNEKKVISDVKN